MAKAIYYKKEVVSVIDTALIEQIGLIVMDESENDNYCKMNMIRCMYDFAMRIADELKEEEE